MRNAAQIPFTVATACPKVFCRAQAPVLSFQATPTHSVFKAHKSTQVAKVAPVATGCLSSTHSLRVIMLHETWNLTLRCDKKLVRRPPLPTTQHGAAGAEGWEDLSVDMRLPVG
jgi:hypothetical protein